MTLTDTLTIAAGIIGSGGVGALLSHWYRHRAAMRSDASKGEQVARDVLWQELTTVRSECAALRAEVVKVRDELNALKEAKGVLAADHKMLLADHERLTAELSETREERDRLRDNVLSLAAKVDAFERGESPPPRRDPTGPHKAIKPAKS